MIVSHKSIGIHKYNLVTMPTSTKYLQGWINPEEMNAEWLDGWKEKAAQLAKVGQELYVFSLPEDPIKRGALLEKIEQLLQTT